MITYFYSIIFLNLNVYIPTLNHFGTPASDAEPPDCGFDEDAMFLTPPDDWALGLLLVLGPGAGVLELCWGSGVEGDEEPSL